MLLVQEERKLRSYRFTLGGHRLLKQAILHPFRQMAPGPDNSLAQGTRKLFPHHAGDRPHGCHSSRKRPTCQRATECQVPPRRPAFSRERAGLHVAREEFPGVPCLEINASMPYIARAISI